ncbi:hypothetical protein LCW_01545 [Latilactobacillus curvatus]|uniref:pentapeptide repeat-containing protein n=1 Tax=Latilactobacillus curvatus TaxID=28038 RepID=UPI00084A034A|nr:pentapeptide repeat-containing protein [Latilactobacillus curvatus]AOO74854.1 hypothetical protein LCW_01545 [Latilactobacillus curvatus]QEA48721.1 pentapeptide repeat-containing protein [Latilactobacillus curvatus]
MTDKKAQAPRLNPQLETVQLTAFEPDETYEGLVFEELTLKQTEVEMLFFKGCLFKNCQFEQVDFNNCDFQDVQFEHCALLNCSLTNDPFQRVAFNGCQLIGSDFAEAGLNDVTFDTCQADYTGFNFARMRHVDFKDCSMQEVSLGQVDWQWLTMIGNRLNGMDMTGTNLKNLDISQNQFEKATFTLELLRGAIISTEQTLVIMSALRINVR